MSGAMDINNVGGLEGKENNCLGNNQNNHSQDPNVKILVQNNDTTPFASIRGKIDTMIRSLIDAELKPVEAYHASKLQSLSSSITSKAVEELSKISDEFKFVVNCVITSKTDDFGLHSSNSCVWDSSLDGHYLFRWENKSIISIVKVFGLHI